MLLACYFVLSLFVTHIISNEHNRACKPSAEVTFFPLQTKFLSRFSGKYFLFHFTLSFILFELLFDVLLFFAFCFLVAKFPVLTVDVTATLFTGVMIYPMLLFFVVVFLRNAFGNSMKVKHYHGIVPYRMNMCYSVYFSIVHTCAKHFKLFANAFSYYWDDQNSYLVFYFFSLLFSTFGMCSCWNFRPNFEITRKKWMWLFEVDFW